MSFPGSQKVPNITGFPVIDTLLKWGIGVGTTALAAWTLGWLSAHGYQSKYLTSENLLLIIVPSAVTLATILWSAIAKYKTIAAMVEKVLEAANSGTVPAEVTAVASASQVARIDAVNRQSR